MDRKKIGKTFFIPASGNRGILSSQSNNVSSTGRYWSAAPENTIGYFLIFASSYVRPQDYNSRSLGQSVRPVQE